MAKELKPLYAGQKFGRLTIIGKDTEKSVEKLKPYYFVKCDCGSPIKSVMKSTLMDKRHPLQSCGCLVKEKAGYVEDRALALKKLIYGKTKDRHIKDLKCDENGFINFDDYVKKIDEPCYYCGVVKDSFLKDRKTGFLLYYNGLDRIDSSKGYTNENTVPACKWCNISKSQMTTTEFKEFIIRLHNHKICEGKNETKYNRK